MVDAKGGGRRWDLTPRAFESLLDRLSSDRLTAAAEYEELRQKLIDFFEGRNSPHPDAYADSTLDRVARKLREGEPIDDVRRYSFGVARLILLEAVRREERKRQALQQLRSEPPAGGGFGREEDLGRLEKCLAKVPLDTQTLLVDYYGGEGKELQDRRQELAERLGISYGALKVRAHRARALLEQCLRRQP